MILTKKITIQEALTYIAIGIIHSDLPEGFDGKVTCTVSEEEDHFDIVAVDNTEQFN